MSSSSANKANRRGRFLCASVAPRSRAHCSRAHSKHGAAQANITAPALDTAEPPRCSRRWRERSSALLALLGKERPPSFAGSSAEARRSSKHRVAPELILRACMPRAIACRALDLVHSTIIRNTLASAEAAISANGRLLDSLPVEGRSCDGISGKM